LNELLGRTNYATSHTAHTSDAIAAIAPHILVLEWKGAIAMKPKTQKTVSTTIGAVGLALMAYMISTESEPGLIPLVLVLSGAIGYATAAMRQRSGG
jgi:hypothetical protein